ncbi:hypothetical protein Tsubulata_038982 [Turnera subulata]|uniref:GIR1-like zinc ribbon domain-containing protein n=1 Tax=Turnera subulata TaxID=218843 RepID=A0A9Q0FJQ5_9ROSI|nr:hypothetical protein Tsubulata_038982 [Turnera subulata]
MSPEISCVLSESEENGNYMNSSSPKTSTTTTTTTITTNMMLVGCPQCLIYVMLFEVDPKCPQCKSTVFISVLRNYAQTDTHNTLHEGGKPQTHHATYSQSHHATASRPIDPTTSSSTHQTTLVQHTNSSFALKPPDLPLAKPPDPINTIQPLAPAVSPSPSYPTPIVTQKVKSMQGGQGEVTYLTMEVSGEAPASTNC